MPMTEKNIALILAAGKGIRLGDEQEKAFVPIGGKPLLAWTLLVFEQIKRIQTIITVVPPGREAQCRSQIVQPFNITKAQVIIPGGLERQDSLQNGFAHISDPGGVVVIHDGARPLVAPTLVEQAIAAAEQHGAAVVAVPVKDTVKLGDDRGLVKQTLDRSQLWLAQTPQAYRYAVIREALEAARRERVYATDDSALVERLGKPVAIVPGSYENIKVTTPEDVRLAALLLHERLGAEIA